MAYLLEGKVAIVTGAGRGIGRAIAVGFARAGGDIACAARTQAEIDETVAMVEDTGRQGLAMATDVTKPGDIEQLYQAVMDKWGRIDILVINAGVNLDRNTVEESVAKHWRATLEVNLFGAYSCAKAVIPHMKEQGGGKIITVGSGLGHNGRAGGSAYSVSKAGLWMLTQVLAQELWPYQISVNELIPGPVETSMTARLGDARTSSVFGIDSEWIKQPQDVVPLALFLATQPAIGPTAQSFSLMRRAQ